jgi:hypothetical protein
MPDVEAFRHLLHHHQELTDMPGTAAMASSRR